MQKSMVAAAIVAGALATPAIAGPTVTSIQIQNATNTYLQVAELEAFSNGVNVALGGTATASSTYTEDPIAQPSKAIDGNTDGNFYDGHLYHSADGDPNPTLTVALNGSYNLSSLTIYGRTDCCSDRDLYTYTLFDNDAIVGRGTLDARTTHVASVALPEPATWAMMLLGFGMIGFGLRYRRRSVSVSVA